jgi:hypothetical protein
MQFANRTLTDEMFTQLMLTSAGRVLKSIQAEDPTLSLKGFCERCLNSIANNGAKSTASFYNVPLGFLENLERVYAEHANNA